VRLVGYMKSEEPSFEKTPDRRVREAIELLFEKVIEIDVVHAHRRSHGISLAMIMSAASSEVMLVVSIWSSGSSGGS
jgi:hypothetical protein